MSSLPQSIKTSSASASEATPRPVTSDAVIRPEMTLAQLEQVQALTNDEEFQEAALRLAAGLTGSRLALLYAIEGEAPTAKAVFSPGGNSAAFFTARQQVDLIAGAALSKGASQRATITLQNGKFALLCVPFASVGRPPMAIALLLGPERAPFLEPAFTVLHLATQVFVRRSIVQHTQKLQDGFDQATLLVDLYSRAARARDFHEALAILSDELRELVGCSRIAIGTGNSLRCKVRAISGAGNLESSSHATSSIAAAMREGIGVGEPVAWPDAQGISGLLVSASQDELLATMKEKHCVTLPLETEGESTELFGAWTFFWSDEHPLTERKMQVIKAATPHVAALGILLRHSYPAGVRGMSQRFWRRASKAKKVVAIAIPLLCLAAMFLPMTHHISASCRIQPRLTSHLAAPFDGILQEALVKPGDVVEVDQVLARLDGREIRWRLAEAIARRDSALKRRDQAMAAKDTAAAQLAQFEADSLDLEVELLEFKRDNLEVRATMDGIVLSGNLERSKGVPVTTGQKLFEIAPIDEFEVEIAIPDAEISHIESGMQVEFRLESQSGFTYPTEIEEIYPISEVQKDQNVFVALATIENSKGELRPGMRGRARIEGEKQPVGWILFHRLWDYLRLSTW